ncbi:hypothetical protein [Nonomuraea sp. SYSU D8015]|uniref:hypothetical protein n=1 Tax=Nonomuraea sp. SYSU D8015 TaxID=2593644 RepID=UPI0016614D3F|nr:hypothetical protein [Nonomuraea sp. SYSU D8015]
MTADKARMKAIRARMAQTGEAYNAAARALDHDQDPAARASRTPSASRSSTTRHCPRTSVWSSTACGRSRPRASR